MNAETKAEITKISQEFASGFEDMIGDIAGSGMLIVDPLSGYLNASGFKNRLKQFGATDNAPLVLIIEFADGTQFVPAGSDLIYHIKEEKGADATAPVHDWMWFN